MKKILSRSIFIGMFLFPTLSFSQAIPLTSGNVVLATSAAAMPNLKVSGCTFQAWSTNVGAIYIGGQGTTNSGGANQGARLTAGSSYSNSTAINLATFYVAADNAGDRIWYGCN